MVLIIVFVVKLWLAAIKMFAVVKFVPSDPDDFEEVEAVPITWLSPGKTRCSWPALKSGDAISRAIKNQLAPSSTWNMYKADVMKICGMTCWNFSIEK